MSAIDDLPPLRDVIKRHALSARKSLGQNFLLDLNLTARIARAAGPLEDAVVIEVGPGPGGLTRALLAMGAKQVIAIERDERALGALEEIADHYPGRLKIVNADATLFDPRPLLGSARAKIVANLPYNIATALLIDWLSVEPWPPWYDTMVLMFQREVAERIVAPKTRRLTAASASCRTGVPKPKSCSTSRPRRSSHSPRSHPLLFGSYLATNPRLASVGCSNRSPLPLLDSVARCCGRALNPCPPIRPGWRRQRASTRRAAPKQFPFRALPPWPASWLISAVKRTNLL